MTLSVCVCVCVCVCVNLIETEFQRVASSSHAHNPRADLRGLQ